MLKSEQEAQNGMSLQNDYEIKQLDALIAKLAFY